MKSIMLLKEELSEGKYDRRLKEIYVDSKCAKENCVRYQKTLERFEQLFPDVMEAGIYSAPGRSEVCGNHTDHQNGMVLAASINLDVIAVAAPVMEDRIYLVSGDCPMEVIDLTRLDILEEEKGTTRALIKGVAAGFIKKGYRIGGFKAYATSNVPIGAGLSSSAAFESLLGIILSDLYNEGGISRVEIAKIGQYAENVYFGKPCGLMDQMACSVGGMIYIDFAEPEKVFVEKIETNFADAGICLCIADTKGSHADLTGEYAAIPQEMNRIAEALGEEHLRTVEEEAFYQKLPMLRERFGDRAVLRSIHFFEEEKRVSAAVQALKASDYEQFLQIIESSGNSSAKYLQNVYCTNCVESQNLSIALAVTERLLGAKGICRIHGGGFAGTIQVFLQENAVENYRNAMEEIFGQGSCHVLQIRPEGCIKV